MTDKNEPTGDDAINPLLDPPFLHTDEPDVNRPPVSERIFGSRAFVKLWVAQLVSAFGDWLGFLAITILAADVGGGSGGAARLAADPRRKDRDGEEAEPVAE